jgi:hypothetical protein
LKVALNTINPNPNHKWLVRRVWLIKCCLIKKKNFVIKGVGLGYGR